MHDGLLWFGDLRLDWEKTKQKQTKKLIVTNSQNIDKHYEEEGIADVSVKAYH